MFLRNILFFGILALAIGCSQETPDTRSTPETGRENMIGVYGEWLSDEVLGNGPARLSFRNDSWQSLEEWKGTARQRLLDCMAPVDLGPTPGVSVKSRETVDGLDIEILTWQLPMGPPTEAVFLKPAGAKGPLPGVLALHDHGGNKFLGWRKITQTSDFWTVQKNHQEEYYEGVAWANELAKRGYAVLVHDTFPFASRRVLVRDVPDQIRNNGVDPDPEDLDGIQKYNDFAGSHEHIMEKSLISAGTTWPGVYLVEDQRALDILASRPEVDRSNLGCAGLSGGGMRTVFLAGTDERIKSAVAVGFMTTWRDFLLYKCFTHTWMTYVPLLPRDLDFPEILGLRVPAATMVLNCVDDPLYTLAEMERADQILKEVYEKAGASENYRCNFYPGPHKFDKQMQNDAFLWFDKHLKTGL